MNVGYVKLRGALGMVMGVECMRYEMANRLRKWIILSSWGRKWQLMEDVKGILHTE